MRGGGPYSETSDAVPGIFYILLYPFVRKNNDNFGTPTNNQTFLKNSDRVQATGRGASHF